MTNTALTVDDMVRREVIQCVSGLVSDLLALTADISRDVAQSISFSHAELLDLQCRPDYEEAGRDHINNMDRDQLLEALDDQSVEDERNVDEIAAAAIDDQAERRRNDGDEYDPDLVVKFPGVSDETLRDLLIAELDKWDEGWKEFSEEHSLDPENIEVYEHWIVSDWLAGKLAGKGEITGEISNLTIWGRCTTGQMISMDHVIQQIHAELVAP